MTVSNFVLLLAVVATNFEKELERALYLIRAGTRGCLSERGIIARRRGVLR